jgi:hypothetical protein
VARGEDGLLDGILPDAAAHADLPLPLTAWLADLKAARERARAAANTLLDRARRLAERSEATAAAIDMRFLYDPDRRLFAIGYLVLPFEVKSSRFSVFSAKPAGGMMPRYSSLYR